MRIEGELSSRARKFESRASFVGPKLIITETEQYPDTVIEVVKVGETYYSSAYEEGQPAEYVYDVFGYELDADDEPTTTNYKEFWKLTEVEKGLILRWWGITKQVA